MTIAQTPEEASIDTAAEVAAEVEDPVVATEQATPADDSAAGDAEAAEAVAAEDAQPADKVVVKEVPLSPFDLPGDWYVIHSYSGYENKVKLNLETRSKSMHMEDLIYEVVIPMEDVVEIKNGKKVTVPRKMFPGYILVRMHLDDDSWYAVRNTPGVTGFVGSANKPVPLARREVERFLGVKEEEDKKAPRYKPSWEIGDSVRVQTGPFADFNGVIEDINLDQSKVVVLVNIFGRDTPVELNFEDIIKN
ncbi:MAG TPA: transcription termination/antitermination protein NusG [Acidimicrobiia bacterium]|nr:transcription termination/antitermination protein NusG [Acidimicrobiia bacterium]